MKIRVTILTENNRPRPIDLSEQKVIDLWQNVFNMLSSLSVNGDTCKVESAEFVEDDG